MLGPNVFPTFELQKFESSKVKKQVYGSEIKPHKTNYWSFITPWQEIHREFRDQRCWLPSDLASHHVRQLCRADRVVRVDRGAAVSDRAREV